MKRINVTYFNNYHIDFDYYKTYYQETYGLNDEEMENVSENEIWNYINDSIDNNFWYFENNLKHSKYNNEYCVITGTLGLWNRSPQIEPYACDEIQQAISKCIGSCDYAIIKQVNGHLEVTGIHHDGANYFNIYLLNEYGVDALKRIREGWGTADLSNRRYHKAIDGYLF